MDSKMKILIIGPSNSGKTTLANCISGHSSTPASNYHPTAGVRILEMEKSPPRANRLGDSAVAIELWDCSGDLRYEKCWSAFRKDINGIIFVFDGENGFADMEIWVKNFAHRTGIPIANCVSLAHFKTAKPKGNVKPPKGLERVLLHETTLENTSNLQLVFDKLFGTIYSSMVEGQERAERAITNA
jgi:Rab-like protein 5